MTCWVYVSNAGSHEIFALALDDGGGLTTIGRYSVAGEVMPLAVTPNRRVLFAALRSPPFGIASFAIDGGSGRLAAIDVTRVPASLCYLATDRSGRFLLSAAYAEHLLVVHRIDAKGAVVPGPEAIVEDVANAHSMITDPSNRYALAASLGGDCVLQFKFDSSRGTLASNAPAHAGSAKGAGPRHLVFQPSGRWVYVVNELDGTVAAHDFDKATGVLHGKQVASVLPDGFAGKAWAADIHVTPDGRLLYCSERGSNTLAAFRIDQDSGALAPAGSFPTETQPRGFAIDPSGRYLLAAGQVSNHLAVHEIDGASGALAQKQRQAMGDDPNWIEIVARPS